MKLLAAVFSALMLVVPLCAGAEQAPKQKLKLGVIVPLTGPLTFFGNDLVRAYDLAAEDYPAIKEHIDVVWEDSAYDSKQAISAFNKLVAADNVDIIYSFGGPMLSALAPFAEARKLPFFASESAKSDCQGRKFCTLFRNEEDEWGQATWKVLRKQGKKTIGIVKNQNQFMNTFVDAILREKRGTETVEILLDVPPDTTDLRANLLNSVKPKRVDAIGVYFLPISHHGFLNALSNLGLSYPLFGVEEFLVKENNKGFENIIDGTLVIAPGAVDAYRNKFESRYGASAGFYYTPAFYDFLVLLKDTAAANPLLRGLDLVKALRFAGVRSGVSGNYAVKVSADGVYSYSFPIFVYRVTGEGTKVEEVINF